MSGGEINGFRDIVTTVLKLLIFIIKTTCVQQCKILHAAKVPSGTKLIGRFNLAVKTHMGRNLTTVLLLSNLLFPEKFLLPFLIPNEIIMLPIRDNSRKNLSFWHWLCLLVSFFHLLKSNSYIIIQLTFIWPSDV